MNFINQLLQNFLKKKVYSGFKDNIWGADLADMQLISSLIKDLDSYYALLIFLVNMLGWLVPLKDEKGISIVNAFKKNIK